MAKKNYLDRENIKLNFEEIEKAFRNGLTKEDVLTEFGLNCSLYLLNTVMNECDRERKQQAIQKRKNLDKATKIFLRNKTNYPILTDRQLKKFYKRIDTVYLWSDKFKYDSETVRLILCGAKKDVKIEKHIFNVLKNNYKEFV